MDATFIASFEFVQLQMQMVIMTATTIRKSLEENNQEAIWQSMEHTESAGVPQQILKQAIVHACAEAGKIRNTHKTWSKNTESRSSRFRRCSISSSPSVRRRTASPRRSSWGWPTT